MTDRTPTRQLLYALAISFAVLVLVVLTSWLAWRVDAAVGHGPLPPSVPYRSAYILAVLVSLLGIASGAGVIVGVRQAKYITSQFAWLAYAIVGLPLLLLSIVPLQRYGDPAWGGLPEFLVSVPARSVFVMALGVLLFGGVDIRRLLSRSTGPAAEGGQVRVNATAVRGLPGRFTPPAWRALSVMQEEAQRFEHAYMGTEHLMLGLLRDLRSQASRAIVNLGGDPGQMRSQLEAAVGRRGSLYTGTTGMTRRCQRVIESAARIGKAAGQRTVGTGHLLQALVESPEDVAGQMLESAGITADRVAAELRRLGPETE
ncbi:MAG: Clp protease N-terminal domain-containing protein [Chloroflexota bacterium]